MKLKQSPDDFQVDELTNIVPGTSGDFSLYRLEKVGWTTHDALQLVRRRWQIDASRLSYGGLKDRHARTWQYFTIFRGPQRNLHQQGCIVTYLGKVPHPFVASDIRGNRFRVTLRALPPAKAQAIAARVPAVLACGVPNYFDDQRFGSVGPEGGFIALELIRGQYEQALHLALAAPYEHDRAAVKREKAILRAHWNDWPTCKAQLPRGHARSIVDYLVQHPTDFRGAVARLKPELRSLYLAAYQSHLWNALLAAWIRRYAEPGNLASMRLKLGQMPVPLAWNADAPDWRNVTLPLPSARLKVEPQAPWAELLAQMLHAEGLRLEDIRIRAFDHPYFAKGERPAFIVPHELTCTLMADDRHPGKTQAILAFELPRGAYATMVVKRLTSVCPPATTVPPVAELR